MKRSYRKLLLPAAAVTGLVALVWFLRKRDDVSRGPAVLATTTCKKYCALYTNLLDANAHPQDAHSLGVPAGYVLEVLDWPPLDPLYADAERAARARFTRVRTHPIAGHPQREGYVLTRDLNIGLIEEPTRTGPHA